MISREIFYTFIFQKIIFKIESVSPSFSPSFERKHPVYSFLWKRYFDSHIYIYIYNPLVKYRTRTFQPANRSVQEWKWPSAMVLVTPGGFRRRNTMQNSTCPFHRSSNHPRVCAVSRVKVDAGKRRRSLFSLLLFCVM